MSKPSDPIRFSVPQRSPADRKKKLGKGLGALLGETQREEPLVRSDDDAANASGQGNSGANQSDSPLKTLSVASIEPLPGNPRKHFDEAALEELAASISKRGVIQPIIVRPRGQGRLSPCARGWAARAAARRAAWGIAAARERRAARCRGRADASPSAG